jgi:hypothetical protein
MEKLKDFFFFCIPFYLQAVQIHLANVVKLLLLQKCGQDSRGTLNPDGLCKQPIVSARLCLPPQRTVDGGAVFYAVVVVTKDRTSSFTAFFNFVGPCVQVKYFVRVF